MNILHRLFSGRIGRLAFLFGALYYIAALLIPYIFLAFAYILILSTVYNPGKSLLDDPIIGLTVVLYAVLIITNVSLAARRLNDVERPTWFCVFAVVPFVNIPFSIYLLIAPGTEGSNMYGPPPSGYGFWEVTQLGRSSSNKLDDDSTGS
jgi:uncharacterized membrane protein YhaH (DUF805 family)